MASRKGGSTDSLPPAVAAENVTGTLSPDATCNYLIAGKFNGQNYYARFDDKYVIWWDGIDSWHITAQRFRTGTLSWKRTNANVEGAYTPQGTATGTATVAAGAH